MAKEMYESSASAFPKSKRPRELDTFFDHSVLITLAKRRIVSSFIA